MTDKGEVSWGVMWYVTRVWRDTCDWQLVPCNYVHRSGVTVMEPLQSSGCLWCLLFSDEPTWPWRLALPHHRSARTLACWPYNPCQKSSRYVNNEEDITNKLKKMSPSPFYTCTLHTVLRISAKHVIRHQYNVSRQCRHPYQCRLISWRILCIDFRYAIK